MSIKSVVHDTAIKHASKVLAPEHARALANAIADDAEGRVVKSVVDMIKNGHGGGPKKKATTKKTAKKTAVKKAAKKVASTTAPAPKLAAVPKPATAKRQKKMPVGAVPVGNAAFPEDSLDL